MNQPLPVKPVLLFACGNPSRGDDALGPELLNRVELQANAPQIEYLTDFQFQIEHAVDLKQRERVIFVDASVGAPAPFVFEQILPAREISHTTHTMSPQAVMDVYQQIYSKTPPPCFLLSIRGEHFELGEPLSAAARNNLRQSVKFILQFLT